jgi:hypothetical protein
VQSPDHISNLHPEIPVHSTSSKLNVLQFVAKFSQNPLSTGNGVEHPVCLGQSASAASQVLQGFAVPPQLDFTVAVQPTILSHVSEVQSAEGVPWQVNAPPVVVEIADVPPLTVVERSVEPPDAPPEVDDAPPFDSTPAKTHTSASHVNPEEQVPSSQGQPDAPGVHAVVSSVPFPPSPPPHEQTSTDSSSSLGNELPNRMPHHPRKSEGQAFLAYQGEATGKDQLSCYRGN